MTDAALTQNYKGAFDGRLTPGKKGALLLVDVVTAYVDPGSSLFAGETAVAALECNSRLLKAARATGMPVIFTNVVYQDDGADGGLFYKKVPSLKNFIKGSPLGEFPVQVTPQEGELVVSKQYPSAFFGTDLAATLQDMGVDTLFITGYSTSGCVRASALDALQNGFAPFVIRDACADRHEAPHEANLFDLQAKYAEVIGENQAFDLIGKLGG
ncbi:isochorismatase family protein [Altererythrobacter sp. ZODW24]|uniref:isochorismatase family protein n=1 Tax=Altererythrobacter sp. ZODW24 TaxID=2185142 RepID=UPI000DF7D95C|nr:isochorismatase family protein [Altererythrobacter sp. ZODW24]